MVRVSGLQIRLNLDIMVLLKGRRKSKQYQNDMDELTGTQKFGSGHFLELRDKLCGDCIEPATMQGHARKEKTSKGDIPSTSKAGG